MRTNPDTPIDPLGSLGSPIKPTAAPAPNPVREFEHINDQNKAVESVIETLRKKQAEQGNAEGWEGLCASPTFTGTYTYSLSDEERRACAEISEFLSKHGAPL